MSSTAEALLVAKKSSRGGKRPGAGRPKTERDDITIKFDRALAAKATYVARLQDVPLAEYITESAREKIEKDFERAAKGDG